MRRLQRRDDPLEPRELGERRKRLLVRHGEIAGPPAVAQVGMLRPDARIVEASRNGMRLLYLALVVRQDRRERAVQDAGAAGAERGAVPARLDPLPRRLDADQLDVVLEERGEDPDRVGAAADAGDHPRGQRALGGERLLARLVADHPLQIADEGRVWRRPYR